MDTVGKVWRSLHHVADHLHVDSWTRKPHPASPLCQEGRIAATVSRISQSMCQRCLQLSLKASFLGLCIASCRWRALQWKWYGESSEMHSGYAARPTEVAMKGISLDPVEPRCWWYGPPSWCESFVGASFAETVLYVWMPDYARPTSHKRSERVKRSRAHETMSLVSDESVISEEPVREHTVH